jgi:hypothetical protein
MSRFGVDQAPLYSCCQCFADYSWPAEDLAVYKDELWCEICWENSDYFSNDGINFSHLDPFIPKTKTKSVRMGTKKPRYVVYIHSGLVPKFYHKELSDAIKEATRLAELTGKTADIIEYYERAKVVGCVHPDGTLEEY